MLRVQCNAQHGPCQAPLNTVTACGKILAMDEAFRAAFAERLSDLLNETERSDSSIAASLGHPRAWLSNFRTGKNLPKTEDLPRLAEAIGCLQIHAGRLVAATKGQVTAAFKRASAAAGIEPSIQGPGIFRHCCGTWLAELGFGRDDLRLILSHAHGDVTARYVHGQEISRKRAMLRALEAHFLKAVARVRRRGTGKVQPVAGSAPKRPPRGRKTGAEVVN
jgi:hypothetical protein